MLKAKSDYPKSLEGKITDKDGKLLKYKGQILQKYPNYNAVIPAKLNEYYRFDLDVQQLEKALEKVKRAKKGEIEYRKLVMYPDNLNPSDLKYSTSGGFGMTSRPSTPGLVTFDAQLFKKSILPYMKATGAKSIYLDKTRGDERGAIIPAGDNIALIMPLLNEYPEEAEKEEGTIVFKTKEIGEPVKVWQSKTKTKQTTKKTTDMKKSTKRSACSSKATRKSISTIKTASRILHDQKEDYKKIFRSEVKKASTPQEGAKKAGRIYRDRYGATAEARWKKALKRAK